MLDVPNASSNHEKFNIKDIEVVVDKKGHNWFKRAHIGGYLGIARIITSIDKQSEEDIRSWAFLQDDGRIHCANLLGKTPKTTIFLFL